MPTTFETDISTQPQEGIEPSRPERRRSTRAAKKLTKQVLREIKSSDGGEITVEADEPILHQIKPRYGLHKHDNTGLTESITRTMLSSRGVKRDIVLQETPRNVWDLESHSNRTVTIPPEDDKPGEDKPSA